VLLALGLMLASFAAGWKIRGKKMQPPVADTIRIERVDTVTLVGEKIDSVIRYVSRPYPVTVNDTIIKGDTMWVQLPYEHRYWVAKDTLEIWHSGIESRIDSAKIYNRHTTEIIHQPYKVVKMPRLTADVGVAAVYHEKQVYPYLVGEMRYNAPKTTLSAFGGIDHQGRWGAGASVTYRINIIK
jgi:hypothetical protein